MTQFVDAFGEYREKRPGSIADFGLNWAGPPSFLAGDTIDTSTWEVPEGITEETNPPASKTGTTTTIWLSGGTEGQEYVLENTITTVGGRTWVRPLRIKVVALVRSEEAVTQLDLNELERVRVRGIRRIRYNENGEKETEFWSPEVLKPVQDEFEKKLSGTSTQSRSSLASHRRG